MTSPVIAMIGTGHMGSSLIGGLINNGHAPDKIWAADPSEEKLSELRERFGIHTTTNNQQAVEKAQVVIFAIKPQIFHKVATDISNIIQLHKPLVISIAAGIRIENMQQWFGGSEAIVRAMPNTPALIGCGATALIANSITTQNQRNVAESILRAVGVAVWVEDEGMLDTVTALSGSGPAYYFLIMETLQEAAEELGLTPEVARLLTLQTANGAARMALESDTALSELRRRVTSPGGTTEKAVSVLEESNVRNIFRKALQAAKRRSEELATMLGDH